MFFFIIPIRHCSADWKSWNDFPYICRNFFASLAQLVEQLIRNEQVVGSSPIGGSFDFGMRIFVFGLLYYFCFKIGNRQSETRNINAGVAQG
jgi:hypothetical protein